MVNMIVTPVSNTCRGYVKNFSVSWSGCKMFTVKLCDCKASQVKRRQEIFGEFKRMS
jgi:hypothetical protein